MRLLIAEKPSLGRTIAAALGLQGSGNEFIEGGDLIVSWGFGHLGDLALPDDYGPEYRVWQWRHLPFLPTTYKLKPADSRSAKQLGVLKQLLHDPRVTEVVNACDAGREGEYIFDLIYRLCGCTKPVLRFWPKSLSDDALRTAYQNLRPGSEFHGLREAARNRAQGDYIVGINATRAHTLLARMQGRDLKGAANNGRVITVVLNLLYERWKAIESFVPQDFWTVHGDFQTPEGTYTGKWFFVRDGKDVDRLPSEAKANQLIAHLKDKPAHVSKVDQKDVRKPSEQLYDLTTLQREANRRYGMTAEKTLEIAQELYLAQLISYPRTSARHLCTDDLALLPKILDALAAHPTYQPFVQEIRTQGWNQKTLSKRYVDDEEVEDHSALTPTEKTPPAHLTEDQKLIYDLIARRLLAMYYPERIEAKTTLLTQVADQTFRTRGTVCKAEGWSRVDPSTRVAREDDEESGALPPVTEGQPVGVRKIYPKKGKTTPPKHYTDDTLLGAMASAGSQMDLKNITTDAELTREAREKGIGTDATRAPTIGKLIQIGFAHRVKKTIQITDSGIEQIETLPSDELKQPQFTGEIEAKLSQIQRGQYTSAAFVADIQTFTTNVVNRLKAAAGTDEALAAYDRQRESAANPVALAFPCPRCKGRMFLREWPSGRYAVCEHSNPKAKKRCGVRWNATEDGSPLTRCRFAGCTGGVTTTKNGSRICTTCEKWQDERSDTDSGVLCERCKQHNYHKLVAKATQKPFYKCPGCEMVRNADAKIYPGACTTCGSDLYEQPYKDNPPLKRCIQAGCTYRDPGMKTSEWERTLLDEKCPTCRTHALVTLRHTTKGTTFDACSDPDQKCKFKRLSTR